MSKRIQLRRGTTTEHSTFTGALGEVTVDTTNKTLRVHDGVTVGGTRLATLTGGLVPVAQLPDATTTVKGAVILNDTLTSTSATTALTAAQGKVLADQDFGVGQTWQNMLGSRFAGVTYTNTTPKTITVFISISYTYNGYFYVNDEVFCNYREGDAERTIICIPIPPNGKYKIQHTPEMWWEMR